MLTARSIVHGSSAHATNGALFILGLCLLQFCRIGVVEADHYVIGFSMVAMCQALLYLAAVWVVLNHPVNRWTFPLILVFAIACRLVCVFADPFLSTDVYRYVWDGRVQAAGINPFRYIPADPHLRFLRDEDIYPNINRRTYAHTIYPPGAQILFLLITRISQSVVCMKAAMVGCEALTVWALVRVLAVLGYPRERSLIYAWHPLLFWEVASSGHVDAAAAAFLALAMLCYVQHRQAATGVALGIATLIKLYPIVLLPAFCRRAERKTVLALAGTVAAGYACYLSVGSLVLGFLHGYAAEEGLTSGDRYFLLTLARKLFRQQGLPTAVFFVFAGGVLLALAVWAYRSRTDQPLQRFAFALAIASTLMVLFSSHYPWYYILLLPLLCVVPYLPMLYFTTASVYLYTTQLAVPGPAMYVMFAWLDGTAAFIALWCLGKAFLQHRRAAERGLSRPGLELDLTSAREL